MDSIKSLLGNVWNIKTDIEVDENNIVEILLKNRGYSRGFLNSTMRNSMPDPYSFIDMEKAVERIYDAIVKKQPFAVLGDYDVDGISSTCIFLKFFEDIGVDCVYTIPNRMDEGYGLNISNIEKYKDHLIIAVDCGSSSTEELTYAKKNNIDVIVIDHHTMNYIPEGAVAIVNPHRPDESNDFKYLCAAGLVFMCVVGINRLLKQKDFYRNIAAPQLTDYLDLVALATVCDVVELKELNRAFVINGLKIIQAKKNLGLRELLALRDKSEVNAETIAFFIGPNLNAGGRLKTADVGVRLLTTKNPAETKELALKLFNLNKERQELESLMVEEAVSMIDEKLNYICAFNPDWHVGVIGIVAGRLKEKYNRPTIIICCDKNGVGKASCRSIEGIDISKIVKKGIDIGIISSGGGHAMAAGFSLPVENIPSLHEFLKTEVRYDSKPKTFNVDAVINLSDLSLDFVKKTEELAPFGQGNPSPIFVISNVQIICSRILKDQHISVLLADDFGNTLKGISFRCMGTALEDALLNSRNKLKILGELCISVWKNTRSVNFLIRDVAESDY
ncbi:MAG: single-stranded-DNA-specific exonuclease RecJ [Alphaproteobacteria bacterium]|nr:single-stranded-DNA-specific exonuclease RecJ [Alphaproteobacteria bacterium]